jgi:hypothetical protein
VDEDLLARVKWTEYPQRQCREPVTDDGMIDHFCGLADLHPGPHAPKTLRAAIERRTAWEQAHPGWEKLAVHDDPFADLTKDMKTP